MTDKIDDIRDWLIEARADPRSILPKLRNLAASERWQTREVAATGLVDVAKRHPEVVLREAARWAVSPDVNVRRAACEGLRGLVRIDPVSVRPVLESLRGDTELYVKKSVANLLRDASAKHPEFVLALCREWARSKSPDTRWIVKEGLRKLRTSQPREANSILAELGDTKSKPAKRPRSGGSPST